MCSSFCFLSEDGWDMQGSAWEMKAVFCQNFSPTGIKQKGSGGLGVIKSGRGDRFAGMLDPVRKSVGRGNRMAGERPGRGRWPLKQKIQRKERKDSLSQDFLFVLCKVIWHRCFRFCFRFRASYRRKFARCPARLPAVLLCSGKAIPVFLLANVFSRRFHLAPKFCL